MVQGFIKAVGFNYFFTFSWYSELKITSNSIFFEIEWTISLPAYKWHSQKEELDVIIIRKLFVDSRDRLDWCIRQRTSQSLKTAIYTFLEGRYFVPVWNMLWKPPKLSMHHKCAMKYWTRVPSPYRVSPWKLPRGVNPEANIPFRWIQFYLYLSRLKLIQRVSVWSSCYRIHQSHRRKERYNMYINVR